MTPGDVVQRGCELLLKATLEGDDHYEFAERVFCDSPLWAREVLGSYGVLEALDAMKRARKEIVYE